MTPDELRINQVTSDHAQFGAPQQINAPDAISRSARGPPRGPVRKVLGFDSWTGGSFNFARLLPAFRERGMTFTIIHIGSWGSDPGRPTREMIGDLEFRDVTYYAGQSFDEILEAERPDAVIMLSTQTFAHRAFLRYCKQRSIPTLHLYHGIANVQVTDDEIGSHKISKVAYAKYALPKIGKLFRRTFPTYMAALLETNAKPKEWARFLADIVRLARGAPSLIAADDAGTSKGAVYTNADIEHAARVYGFHPRDVVPVGNPDLIRFGLEERMLGFHNRRTTLELPCVMYVDTALSIVGLLFDSHTSFVEHMISTAKALAAQGKTLAWKPHPAHDLTVLRESLSGSGIEFVENDHFVPKLMQCCACITETTSVALVPAVLGMPLLLARYGELKEQRFGRALTSYPRGYILDDLSQIGDILRTDIERLDSEALSDWISFNAGPLPADDMPRRVAAIVESMILEETRVAHRE